MFNLAWYFPPPSSCCSSFMGEQYHHNSMLYPPWHPHQLVLDRDRHCTELECPGLSCSSSCCISNAEWTKHLPWCKESAALRQTLTNWSLLHSIITYCSGEILRNCGLLFNLYVNWWSEVCCLGPVRTQCSIVQSFIIPFLEMSHCPL